MDRQLRISDDKKSKAVAVKACLEGEISRMAPALILRTHPNVTAFLDRGSAAQLGLRSQVQGPKSG